MKNIVLFILVLCCIVAALGCSSHPSDDWQTIHFLGCGIMKIPEEWRMFEKDGRFYIVDVEDRPIMIQTYSYCGINDGDQGETESNEYFEDVTNIKYLSTACLSNCVTYGEVLVAHENEQIPRYFLSLGYEKVVDLVVWDETMDEEMLLDIAETFVIE